MSDIRKLLDGISDALEIGDDIRHSVNLRMIGLGHPTAAKGTRPSATAASAGTRAKKNLSDLARGQLPHGEQQSVFRDQPDEETCEGRELAMRMQEEHQSSCKSHRSGTDTHRKKAAAPDSAQAVAQQMQKADIARMREGILWSEVLGEPVSVRRRRRREEQYGYRSNAH